jgi:O-acetyl-ADP-ribose deacetylase (regulator of RNase III)
MSVSPLALEPVRKAAGNTTVSLIKGDLTDLEVDAFVYYCRQDLQIGSGYGTAIQNRGGVAIQKECDAIGTVAMGKAVATGAGELKQKHIIHACGPKHLEAGTEDKLRQCMMSALAKAEELGCKTLAFPPMGLGFYGVPAPLCGKVMSETIKQHIQSGSELREIIICAIDNRDFDLLKDSVSKI